MLVITLLGAGIRFIDIGKQPLWSDEAFSVWMGSHSIADIIKLTIEIDQHPPLYHILLHLWMSIGGQGEAWVRSLSALFGILTIIVIYFLGKTLSGALVGLLSALVLALSPFHIQYGQEARSYAMLGLFASLSMVMTARLLLDSCAHTQLIGQQLKSIFSSRARGSRLPLREMETDLSWLGYMLFSALAMLTHNTGFFLPLGTNLFVFGLMILRRFAPDSECQMQAPSLRNWLIAQAGVFLFWSPWLPGLLPQAMGVAGDFWIQPPTVESVLNTLKEFLMAYLPNQIQWQAVIWLGFGIVFALAFRKYRRRAGFFVFAAVLFLTPVLGELLVSLRRPIFYDRTLIWSTIPLYVLIAAGISQLRHRSYLVTATLILVTLSGLSIDNFFQTFEKERWDLAAAYVNGKLQKGDIIVFNAGWAEIPFDYYFARFHQKVEEFGAPETMFQYHQLEPRMAEKDIPRLRSIIQGRKRVWLVYSHNWWTDPQSIIPKEMGKALRLQDVKNFNGMQIQLYGAP